MLTLKSLPFKEDKRFILNIIKKTEIIYNKVLNRFSIINDLLDDSLNN